MLCVQLRPAEIRSGFGVPALGTSLSDGTTNAM